MLFLSEEPLCIFLCLYSELSYSLRHLFRSSSNPPGMAVVITPSPVLRVPSAAHEIRSAGRYPPTAANDVGSWGVTTYVSAPDREAAEA